MAERDRTERNLQNARAEISRLRTEVERLSEALAWVADFCETHYVTREAADSIGERARTALRQPEEQK